MNLEEMQKMMEEYFRIGHKYPSVTIHATYSFGLYDQEFMLAFETDDPSDFLDLFMELGGISASSYTQLETPIFTCASMRPTEMVHKL